VEIELPLFEPFLRRSSGVRLGVVPVLVATLAGDNTHRRDLLDETRLADIAKTVAMAVLVKELVDRVGLSLRAVFAGSTNGRWCDGGP
jgi:hypothetical protein